MGKSIQTLKNQARRLVEKGKHEKTLPIYQELSRAEPDNPRWPKKIGEVHSKLDQRDQAVEAFGLASRLYAEQGFLVKAIALCKMILSLNPAHEETQEVLVRLYSTRYKPAASHAPAAVKPAGSSADYGMLDLEAAPTKQATPATPTKQATPATPTKQATPATPTTRQKKRTLPPGASLDAVSLGAVIPDARRQPRPADQQGQVYEIPLEDEMEEAFEEAFQLETPRAHGPQVEMLSTPLFSSLDQYALRMLIEQVELRSYAQGERILNQGEPGDSLYILVEGEVTVYHEGSPRVEVHRLSEGAFFGEIALLTNFRRSATVEATQDITVLEISRGVLSDLIEEHPAVLKVLLRFFRDRLIDTLIDTAELFAPFGNEDRRQLVSRFLFLEAEAGTHLIQEGQPADGLYILLSGALKISRQNEEERQRITDLGPGSVVGEMSLLANAPAVNTITARNKCWLVKLERRTFKEVIMTHPQVLAFLSTLADDRKRMNAAILANQIPYEEIKLPVI